MTTLNTSQKNSLYAALYGFEVSLHKVEKWLMNDDEKEGILFLQTLNINQKAKKTMQIKVRQALKKIQFLKEKYRLPKREEGLAEHIISLMSISWADLEDSKARSMRNYGELDEDVGKELDADLGSVIKIAKTIFNTVDQNRQVLLK